MLLRQVVAAILQAELAVIRVTEHQRIDEFFGLKLRFPAQKAAFACKCIKPARIKNTGDTGLECSGTIGNKPALIENKWSFSPIKMLLF